ncbi:hypothetical protein AJ87_48000 [Rhizobium yanglingense]|nr:hypothetical protein AJ87_48000 [Rhizobium yanglingense]
MDKGDEVIVGVNKYRLENEEPIDILEIDNSAVRAAQIKRIEETKRRRDSAKVAQTLAALVDVARSGKGNLLAAAVEAARARATVGEISDAMRKAFGDHAATPRVIKDVYGEAYRDEPELAVLKSRMSDVSAALGRRPKIMVAKLGQDGHDRGAKVIASAFGDIGFDVLAGPLFQTPEEAAQMAIGENVNVIGVSSLAAGHKTLLPQLVDILKAKGGGDVIVICGGVIPRQDYSFWLITVFLPFSAPARMCSTPPTPCWILCRESGATSRFLAGICRCCRRSAGAYCVVFFDTRRPSRKRKSPNLRRLPDVAGPSFFSSPVALEVTARWGAKLALLHRFRGTDGTAATGDYRQGKSRCWTAGRRLAKQPGCAQRVIDDFADPAVAGLRLRASSLSCASQFPSARPLGSGELCGFDIGIGSEAPTARNARG